MPCISAYPNPFNDAIQIGYSLPKAIDVQLIVYDINGRNIEVLMNERQKAGRYRATWQARGMATGMYFLRLEAAGQVSMKKVILIK